MIKLKTLFIATLCGLVGLNAQTITNDIFWDTVDNTPIYSQGGGIFKFPDPETGKDAYFWYGVHYAEAELYRADPSVTYSRNRMQTISCYKSTDLTNWVDVGPVLTATDIQPEGRTGWVGRMGVGYIKETGQYALLVQHNNSVMIALCDTPTGRFQIHKHIDMTSTIGTPNTGDQTVFVDEDTGIPYLVYSYGRGRHIGYISEIGVLEDGTIGLKNCVQVFKGAGREGNCMFKYKGKYYLCASNLYGWDSSYAYYLVSDDIYGPYEPVNNMEIMKGCEMDYAHITQTGFFYTVRGSKEETVIYCGDRWADFAGNGLGYNQWVPLSFEGDKPVFNSLSNWTLNEKTGEWAVGKDNNYILNGSFEADRRIVPIPVKPRQEHLLAWDTKVIQGSIVALANPRTPQLNYENSREDRKQVIGEKSLRMSDRTDFIREVSQLVESRGDVELKNGKYRLSFKFRDSGEFKALKAIVKSAGKTYELDMKALESNDKWTEATLDLKISGGSAKVTFRAEGEGGSQCLIDDVVLKRI